MIRRPPRSTRMTHSFPTRRSSDLTRPTRVDVGIAQINLGYQKHRYSRPCDLLDPYANLAIAAAILLEQYKPGEDWLLALGRYHRPAGGEPAARYRRTASRHLNSLRGSTAVPPAPHPAPKTDKRR